MPGTSLIWDPQWFAKRLGCQRFQLSAASTVLSKHDPEHDQGDHVRRIKISHDIPNRLTYIIELYGGTIYDQMQLEPFVLHRSSPCRWSKLHAAGILNGPAQIKETHTPQKKINPSEH
jgi:hypothetical protein